MNTPTPPTVKAPYSNIFAQLSNDEAAGVIQFLHDQSSLNLTAADEAGDWDNSILVVDLYTPNKTDALAYFDGGASPERWAIASMVFGATEEPYVQDWVVGPLPIAANSTQFYPYTPSAKVPEGKIRVRDMDSSHEWTQSFLIELSDVLGDLLQANFTSGEAIDETFSFWGIDPLWYEPNEAGEERTIYWAQIWRNAGDTGADTLLPQGVYFRFDITGRDKSQWSLTGILYGDEYYHSVDEFRSAWQQPDFKKMPVNTPGEWMDLISGLGDLPLDTLPPPQSVQAAGQQRFKVDEEQKYVEWMDFSFFVTFTRDTGMRLFDVKYKGERIIYEIGLQEAIAHYAGNDPTQSGTAYLDTYYGFGPFCFNQIPGYDMPLHAYCMKTDWHADELSRSRDCGITVFEQEMPYLMQRHSSASYVSATKNIALTVRSVSTVGNYDYQFEYNFFTDGSIETVVRASGYIQSAFFANNTEYGYQIHDALSGSMHDHALQFKVDMDIKGVNNTLVKHAFEPADVKYKWSNVTRSTMKKVITEVTNEDEGKMNWKQKEQVLIVNKDALNKYGEEIGYKIMPGRGSVHRLTIGNSTNLQNSGSIGYHDYFVTKQKDTERRSVSAWNAYDPKNPLINFGDFFDGEDLEQEDLVFWFNIATHHMPTTSDIPNTVFTGAQGSIMIIPHNSLDRDPSRESSQRIFIAVDEDGVASDVQTFGQQSAKGTYDLGSAEWDPSTYVGDYAIRKFPYDPQNPFNQTAAIG